jgi:hypothetical protein
MDFQVIPEPGAVASRRRAIGEAVLPGRRIHATANVSIITATTLFAHWAPCTIMFNRADKRNATLAPSPRPPSPRRGSRPYQGLCHHGRRDKMVEENDPEGVAFEYEVLE